MIWKLHCDLKIRYMNLKIAIDNCNQVCICQCYEFGHIFSLWHPCCYLFYQMTYSCKSYYFLLWACDNFFISVFFPFGYLVRLQWKQKFIHIFVSLFIHIFVSLFIHLSIHFSSGDYLWIDVSNLTNVRYLQTAY